MSRKSSPKSFLRQRAEKKGKRAETLACWWLRLKGYQIIARRAKTPKGEIDIIARRGKTLVFIEVKARRNFDHGIQSVTPRQMRRIVAAVQYWCSSGKNRQNLTCRFDIVLVKPYLLIRHLENAFDERARGPA